MKLRAKKTKDSETNEAKISEGKEEKPCQKKQARGIMVVSSGASKVLILKQISKPASIYIGPNPCTVHMNWFVFHNVHQVTLELKIFLN